MNILSGECLCEAISYEVRGPISSIINCHCSMCRRWHGAAFRTRCTVNAKDFKWTKGEKNLSRYRSSEAEVKTFCRICGSNLISMYDDNPDQYGLPIGGIRQDPGKRPEAHIFVDSKAVWHKIVDDLPRYEGLPPEKYDLVE